ncbi:MAG: heme exporter protein CcmD [Gammaproteobacteria bacterium]|nr:heme exporter protein CcmD [Gammaproteobacteria bacterium]
MSEFFAMGGYAAYVWSAFGITAFTMIVLAVLARRADRRALDRIRRREENRK